MAKEITANDTTGGAVYAILVDAVGRTYNGSSFEAIQDANWGNYDIALTEAGATGIYQGDMPAVAAGVYYFVAFRQAGGSPAVSDTKVGVSPTFQWDGSVEVSLSATVTAVVTAIFAKVVDGTYTFLEGLRFILASTVAKVSGGGTGTVTFRDLGDGTDRIVTKVNLQGDRTGVVLDGS